MKYSGLGINKETQTYSQSFGQTTSFTKLPGLNYHSSKKIESSFAAQNTMDVYAQYAQKFTRHEGDLLYFEIGLSILRGTNDIKADSNKNELLYFTYFYYVRLNFYAPSFWLRKLVTRQVIDMLRHQSQKDRNKTFLISCLSLVLETFYISVYALEVSICTL